MAIWRSILQMKRQSKIEEISKIIEGGGQSRTIQQPETERTTKLVHAMRAVVIILDVTKSITMKDFKPSRQAAAVIALREFIKKYKQSTPVAIAALGLASKGICRMATSLTFSTEEIIKQLQEIHVETNPGCLSYEQSLFQAILTLDQLPSYFTREVLVFQSSPMTKDQHSLQQTIQIMKVADMRLNTISMCGWTEAIKRSVQKLNGKYVTVSSGDQCLKWVNEFAVPPAFKKEGVKIQLVKMALVRKEQTKEERRCMCHFKVVKVSYICTVCESISCKQPPTQCTICKTLLVMPTDLYNHTIL